MAQEDNRLIMRRMIEAIWNEGDLDAADELFAADHTSPSAPGLPPGPEGVKMIARMFREAMPDYSMTIDLLAAHQGGVAARFIQSGTHTGGALMGTEASGRRAEWSEIGELAVQDGKIVTSWYVADTLGMLQQLGGQLARRPVPSSRSRETSKAPLSDREARSIVERFVDVLWREGRVDLIDDIVAEDYVDWEIDPAPADRDALAEFIAGFRAAFSGLQYDLQHVFCDGDLVVSRDTVRATHAADFAGLTRTGKRVEVSALHIMRIADGKVAEHWGETDRLAMMQQLGVLPTG